MNRDYKIIEQSFLEEIQSEATMFKHTFSGAKIIYLKNSDENKVFSVSFKTPPFDDTGLFHILEHSVLAGSRKYPVREPFIELVKGSLYTFLNAMTFSDKTMYPIGSCNDKDFHNLMGVYLDSVFFPKIYDRKESFLQEAWNYSIKNKNEPIKYNGIVYNEMKGAYSNPLRALDNLTNKHLFPDTAYRFDSGGDPAFIPKLDYTSFLEAHKKYYHPANSCIYFYGNMDIEKCFEFLHKEYLCKFCEKDFKDEVIIEKQGELGDHVFCDGQYSVPKNSNTEGKNILSASFVAGEYSQLENYYAFKLLSNILLATPASPVKKELLEKNLGEEVLGGFDSDLLQPIFTVTVKNSKADLREFEKTLMSSLENLVSRGIDKKLITSCINKAEFLYREEDYQHRPKGLVYNIACLSNQLYGGNPFDKLRRLETISAIKAKAEDTPYFENLITQYLLQSKHCVYAALKPKRDLNREMDNKRIQELSELKSSLSESQLDELVKATAGLDEYLSKKDSDEDLAKIPFVQLSDVRKEPELIKLTHDKSFGYDLLYTDIKTNGIVYANLLFDTDKVGEDKRYTIGLLCYLLGKMSTVKRSYSELSNEINTVFGGFSVNFFANKSVVETGSFRPKLIIKTKSLPENKDKVFSIVDEILNGSLFDDRITLKRLLIEKRSGMENMFLSSGNSIAVNRAESYLSNAGKYSDDVSGVGFYNKVKEITDNFEHHADELIFDLNNTRRLIFNKNNYVLNLTCGQEHLKPVRALGKIFYDGFLCDEKYTYTSDCDFRPGVKNEGFATSARVQYNAMAGNYKAKGYEYSGYLKLLANVISNVYFMEEIRLKGGAYGYKANILEEGSFQFSSYRDPNLKNTYNIFNGVADFVKKIDANENEMRKYILGTINALDRPLLPRVKGELALSRCLCGKTEDMLIKERNEILTATPKDLRDYSHMLDICVKDALICTVGSSKAVEDNREAFDIIHNLTI